MPRAYYIKKTDGESRNWNLRQWEKHFYSKLIREVEDKSVDRACEVRAEANELARKAFEEDKKSSGYETVMVKYSTIDDKEKHESEPGFIRWLSKREIKNLPE